MLGVLHLDAHTYRCLAVHFRCSHPSTSAVGALCVENNHILTCHQLCLCLSIPVPCVFILWFFQVYCNMLCIGVTRKWDHETWSHDVDKNFGQVKLGSLPGACEAFWLFDPNIPSSLTDLQQKVVLPGFSFSFQRYQIKQDMSSANKSSKLSLACF